MSLFLFVLGSAICFDIKLSFQTGDNIFAGSRDAFYLQCHSFDGKQCSANKIRIPGRRRYYERTCTGCDFTGNQMTHLMIIPSGSNGWQLDSVRVHLSTGWSSRWSYRGRKSTVFVDTWPAKWVPDVLPMRPQPPSRAPATAAPPTTAPPTRAPQTEAPPTTAPQTTSPLTGAPSTKAPQTRAPPTDSPPTAEPQTEGEAPWDEEAESPREDESLRF